MQLLIGQISYLNSQPFYPLLGEHRLVAMPPRELGRLAERGEIDAGIMATADYLSLEDRYQPAADLGIANHQEVRSILLYARRPLSELGGTRIGITEETSTSIFLLRLLLEARQGIRPADYVRGLRGESDAFLLIGNEALRSRQRPPADFPYRYDLATEWWNWKKLPFVFALWVIKRTLPAREKEAFRELLERSLVQGMVELDAIAARHAGEMGSAEELASYLRNFHYRLGTEEKRGLQEFRRLLHHHRLLEPVGAAPGSA
jgi:chorismate dehydratase